MNERRTGKYLLMVLLLQPLLIPPGSASDKSAPALTVTRPNETATAAPAYSKKLGVQAVPMSMVIDGATQEGLYLLSNPDKALGKALKLRENVLLLTLDGYAVNNVASMDSYLERRAKNKALTYSYIPIMSGGSSEGKVRNGKYQMVDLPAQQNGNLQKGK